MSDYAWDVLEYVDLSSNQRPVIGEPFGSRQEVRVVAVTPPIHEGRDATVLLSFGTHPLPEVEARLRGPTRVAREDLRTRLAQSSHDTYERHYLADSSKDPDEMVRELHEHDWDRADAAIAVLEELGVWSNPTGS